MRAIWSGVITFGLVSIPVKLYPATQDEELHFHQLHKEDGGRVRYLKVCGTCSSELESLNIVKGYEYAKDQCVEITEADLENLPLPSKQTLEIQEFVDVFSIDPVYFQKSYYLGPQKGADKAYCLLVEALRRTGQAALVKLALRDKEHLALIRVYRDVLAINTMCYVDEVRDCSELAPKASVNQAEVNMAVSLVEALRAPEVDLGKYHDEYRDLLLERINAKISGTLTPTTDAAPAQPRPAEDLFEALRASVAAAKGASTLA